MSSTLEPSCQYAETNLLSLHQHGLFRDLSVTASTNNTTKYNTIPPPEFLPGYKRQAIHILCPPWLRFLITATLIYSKNFLLYYYSWEYLLLLMILVLCNIFNFNSEFFIQKQGKKRDSLHFRESEV